MKAQRDRQTNEQSENILPSSAILTVAEAYKCMIYPHTNRSTYMTTRYNINSVIKYLLSQSVYYCKSVYYICTNNVNTIST